MKPNRQLLVQIVMVCTLLANSPDIASADITESQEKALDTQSFQLRPALNMAADRIMGGHTDMD